MAGTSERVCAVVSIRSMGGQSTFDPKAPITASNAGAFAASLEDTRYVADTLIRLGFEVTNFHPIAISFSGTPTQFNRAFGVHLHRQSRSVGRGRMVDLFHPTPDDSLRLLEPPTSLAGKIDGVAIACPPKLVDETTPPVIRIAASDRARHCLPDELAMSIWGDGLASFGATGRGVVAALIGTGHYRHRFFAERGYRVLPTLLGPGRTDPLRDDDGYGTGEAACLFAAAPDLRVRPVKGLIDPTGDILMTVDSRPEPDLIVNGWGYDVDQFSWDELSCHDLNLHNYLRTLEAAIAYATARGMVVCSTASRAWQSFPAAHPDVIAIAAVPHDQTSCPANQSSTISGLYSGRHVPDFWCDAVASVQQSGHLDLSGCTLPAQPEENSGLKVPSETADQGESWTWSDMASTACPLTVSMLALLMEQHRGLTPAAIKELMIDATSELMSADPVRAGGSNPAEAIASIGSAESKPARSQPHQMNEGMAALAAAAQPSFPETGAAS